MKTPGQRLGARLRHQLIEQSEGAPARDPADVVSCLCAMQAQDYAGALWSVGLRSGSECTEADVELALAERLILRSWPMRGTLHFVAPADVRWMLALLSPRVLAGARTRHAQLGITENTVERARAIFSAALVGGRALDRGQMMERLEAEGIDSSGQRGYHLLWVLAQQGLICFGAREGKQQTFVLLDEWAPPTNASTLERPRALGKLATRYFEARGPATPADFAWWAGITKSEAREGIEAAGDALELTDVGGDEYQLSAGNSGDAVAASELGVHLLPGFDEYLLGYADRSLQLGGDRGAYKATISANGMFSATLVVSGRVVGTWKRTLRRGRVDIAVRPMRELTAAEKTGLAEAAERYGRFLGLEPHVAL
jgi:hypothetical protein